MYMMLGFFGRGSGASVVNLGDFPTEESAQATRDALVATMAEQFGADAFRLDMVIVPVARAVVNPV